MAARRSCRRAAKDIPGHSGRGPRRNCTGFPTPPTYGRVILLDGPPRARVCPAFSALLHDPRLRHRILGVEQRPSGPVDTVEHMYDRRPLSNVLAIRRAARGALAATRLACCAVALPTAATATTVARVKSVDGCKIAPHANCSHKQLIQARLKSDLTFANVSFTKFIQAETSAPI